MQWKQTDDVFRSEIQTDGCLFLSLGSIAEEAAAFSSEKPIAFEDPEEIERTYQYVIPNYMRDGGQDHKNRCYINDHVAVIRAYLNVLGIRKAEIEYLYRHDMDTGHFVVGGEFTEPLCQYFVKKVPYGEKGSHFLRCTRGGTSLYNPGITDGEMLSLRGYRVKIL